jgi:hypothetical protein
MDNDIAINDVQIFQHALLVLQIPFGAAMSLGREWIQRHMCCSCMAGKGDFCRYEYARAWERSIRYRQNQ